MNSLIDDDNDNDDFFCSNGISLFFFFLHFFSLRIRKKNKNIKVTIIRHPICDADLCECVRSNSHRHIVNAPACSFSFTLSFQIVTSLYFRFFSYDILVLFKSNQIESEKLYMIKIKNILHWPSIKK